MQEAERAFAAQQMIANGTIKDRAMSMTGASAGVMKYMASLNITSVSEMTFAQRVRASAIALKEQALAWAATPMGMATIAVTSISLLISGFKAWKQNIQETRQELMQLGQQAADTNKQLYDLISQYSKLGKDGQIDLSDQETAKGIQEQIVELVGDQAKNIDLVNGKYDEEIEKLQQIKALGVGDSYNDISRAAKSAEANLRDGYTDKGFDGSAAHTIMGGSYQTKSESEAIKKVMTENGFEDFISETQGVYKFKADMTSPEKMVESYYKAVELTSVIARDYGEDIENSEGALYDFYNNLNKFIDNNKEDVEAYSAAIKNLHTMDANADLAEYLKTNDINNQDAFDSYIEGIKNSTEYSDAYKQVLIDVANDAFPQFSNSAKDAGENVNKMTVSLENLKNASESISSLSSAFKQLSDDGYISTEAISKIQEATGLADEQFASYKQTLLTAKAGSDELNQAMAELTYTILDKALADKELTDATEDEIAATLRENNVLNANEVAHNAVERAKAKEIVQSKLSKDVSADNIEELLKEAAQCDLTADAYVYLITQEILFNRNDLNPEQKIKALQEIARQAGLTGAAISAILNTPYEKSGKEQKAWAEANGFTVEAKKDKNGKVVIKNGRQDWVWTDKNGNTYENANEAALSLVDDAFSDTLTTEKDVVPVYSKVSLKERDEIQKDLVKKEKEFAENMAEAWKKEHLAVLQDSIKEQENILNQYKGKVESIDFGLSLFDEDDFNAKSTFLNNKLDTLTSYGEAMRAEFDRIASTIPQTGEEAELLAKTLDTLGSEMRDNVSTIHETWMELHKLPLEMANVLMDTHFEGMRKQMDDIDRYIEILDSGYADEYSKYSNLFNIDSLLPVYSEYDKQRIEKQRASKKLIDIEQETQDKINAIVTESLQMQSEENAKARAKERQKLKDDMTEVRNDIQEKLGEIYQDSSKHMENTVDLVNNSLNSIKSLIENLNIELPEVDITKFQNSLNNAWAEVKKGYPSSPTDVPWVSVPLENSRAVETQGYDKNCVGYARARSQEITGKDSKGKALTSESRAQTFGYNLSDRVTPDDMDKLKNSLVPGSIVSLYTTYTPHDKGGYYGHVIVVEDYDPSTGMLTYSDNNTGKNAIRIKLSDYMMQLASKGHYITGVTPPWAYAVGTPRGNAKASRFGIAGENYKPEILVDKATGATEYISEPTVIDLDKTDVVGEKQTAKMPKFATGTPMTNEKYLKEIKEACDIFNIPYNIALSLIDQESANGTASDTWRKNSEGAVGLTQVTSSALGDFRETWNSVSKEIVDQLIEHGVDFENSRTENESAYRDNIWTGIANLRLINDRYFSGNDTSWANTLGWYYAGGNYDGSDGRWYANQVLNRASTDAFMSAISSNASYTPQTSPSETETSSTQADKEVSQDKINKEAINEIEKTYETFVDSIGKIEAKYTPIINAILNDSSLSEFDKSQKLYDEKYNMGKEMAGVADSLSATINSQFEQYIKDIEQNPNVWSLDRYNAYKDALASIKDEGYENLDDAIAAKHTQAQQSLDNSQKWIEEREFYDDWEKYGDNKVAAWQRVIDRFEVEYPKEKELIDELKRNVYTSQKESYTAGKDALIDAIEQEIKAYEKLKESEKELLELQSSRYGSLSTLLQSHYNVTNAISDAQYELNKELAASKTMYEWLDKDTRELLFNQEDYNTLVTKLGDIQNQANRLQQSYNTDILSATKDNIEEITSQYEMQYETLMKSYEIAKADLEVAKKKQQLNNVLAEKNVKMFVNGQWQWVANTQDVMNAQNELADAEHAKSQAETSLSQGIEIDKLTSAQNAIATTINNIDTEISKTQETWEKIQDTMTGQSLAVSAILNDIATSDSFALQNIIHTVGSGLADFYESITDEKLNVPTPSLSYVDYADKMQKATSKADIIAYNTLRNAKIQNKGLDVPQMTDAQAIEKYWKGKDTGGYGEFINSDKYLPISHDSLYNGLSNSSILNQLNNARGLLDLNSIFMLSTSLPYSVARMSEAAITIGDIIVNNPADSQDVVDNVFDRLIQGFKLNRRSM